MAKLWFEDNLTRRKKVSGLKFSKNFDSTSKTRSSRLAQVRGRRTDIGIIPTFFLLYALVEESERIWYVFGIILKSLKHVSCLQRVLQKSWRIEHNFERVLNVELSTTFSFVNRTKISTQISTLKYNCNFLARYIIKLSKHFFSSLLLRVYHNLHRQDSVLEPEVQTEYSIGRRISGRIAGLPKPIEVICPK